MKTITNRYRVLPTDAGCRVVEVRKQKFAQTDLLDCKTFGLFLQRLGLLKPVLPCSDWFNEFDLTVSDGWPESGDNLIVFVSIRGGRLHWSPACVDGDEQPLDRSYDLFYLTSALPESELRYLTIQPVGSLMGSLAKIGSEEWEECPPNRLKGLATDLDASDLIDLVPGLNRVEGFISGLRADADCCWEGHAAIVLHRDEILRRIAHYVGPNAKTWMSKTEDPRTRTQEAYDTMVEHFFEECPDNDPQMAAYLEARKSPEGLKHFFAVTVPAFWTSRPNP